ncbi:MAG: Carboxymethylenebutenolidase [Paracidovorax wautersii]|uniref:Carboxymethylenebutenolidase n=1 Tax=Paracidovorax wautersii TaxID=1177982 RepID=A0A7V8FRY1_9BURK|nr:MAG: Carboxymethylenebutenolidase [Paracidovorax wautersii]
MSRNHDTVTETAVPPAGIIREDTAIAADGGRIDAYLAAPAEGGPQVPGVVLVMSIFGVDSDTKNHCDRLATSGHVALAPNFFWRDPDSGVLSEAEVPRAIGRAMRANFDASMDDLRRAIARVREHPRCNGKVAVLGYCFGGPHAWRAACDGLGIDAAVSFHGTHVSKYLKPGDRPACPVAFHYGELDDFAPPEELAAVGAAARAGGSEFHVHPGAGHAYMMPGNSHYHAQGAQASWEAALRLLAPLRG